MEELNSMICKTCGGRLDVLSAVDGVLKCEYCGNLWTVPKPETNKNALHFLRIGEHELDTCKFDDAYAAYAKAATEDGNEPEAYFGMALAEFKVQYIKDEVNKRVQPICHISSEKKIESKKFSENKNYLIAIEKATNAQKVEYIKKANEIDQIREQFLKLKSKGIEYDCFICVKVTEPGHEKTEGNQVKYRTVDYKIADDLYFNLRGYGFKPFFSERELKDQTGSDYEAFILYALYSAECMLVVCSNEEYLDTPWVKNEYTRFSSMIADERKESDSLTIVFKGAPIERLPGRNGKIQGISYDSLDALERIKNFVDSHSPEGKKKREEAARQRAEEERKKAEAERKLIEEQEALRKQFEEQNKMFEERLRNMRTSESAPTTSGTATVNSLLLRAKQDLEYGDMNSAKSYYDRVLDASPECSEAWWGLFLIEYNVNSGDKLLKDLDCQLADKINANRNYNNAVRYSDGNFTTPAEFASVLSSPKTWWDKFLDDMGGNERDIIKNVSKASLKKIKNSRNYANAKKFADEEFDKKIKRFEADLESAPAHWNLFLEELGVKNENDLLPVINETKLLNIESNSYYRSAMKSAEGEFRTRVDKFQKTLYSGELWWDKFLESMQVSNEKALLGGISDERKKAIEENEFYISACKYAEGEIQSRIEAFKAELYSGELWWDRFLEVMHVKNESEIYDIYDGKRLLSLKSDKRYLNAKEYAKGELAARIKKFDNGLENSDLWLKYFLRDQDAASLSEFYDKTNSIKVVNGIIDGKNEFWNKTVRYADSEQTVKYNDFIAKLRALRDDYNKGQQCWQQLIKEFDQKTESGLLDIVEPINDSENYKQAVEYTRQSKDSKMLTHMLDFAEKQAKNAVINTRKRAEEKKQTKAMAAQMRRKMLLRKCFMFVKIVLLAVFAVGTITFFAGVLMEVEPLSEFWLMWMHQIFGIYDFDWSVSFVPLLGLVGMAAMFVVAGVIVGIKAKKNADYKINLKKHIFSVFLLVICVVTLLTSGSAAVCALTRSANNSDYAITNECVMHFKETEGGYQLVLVYDKGVSEELTIPSEFKGKPVIKLGGGAKKYYIASSGFIYGRKEKVEKINIPDSVTTIGSYSGRLIAENIGPNVKILEDYAFCEGGIESIDISGVEYIGKGAFESCYSLKSIVIPEAVTEIKEDTFNFCEKMESITLGSNITTIGARAFYRCSALKTIYFAGTKEQWDAIQKGDEYNYGTSFNVVCSDS